MLSILACIIVNSSRLGNFDAVVAALNESADIVEADESMRAASASTGLRSHHVVEPEHSSWRKVDDCLVDDTGLIAVTNLNRGAFERLASVFDTLLPTYGDGRSRLRPRDLLALGLHYLHAGSSNVDLMMIFGIPGRTFYRFVRVCISGARACTRRLVTRRSEPQD